MRIKDDNYELVIFVITWNATNHTMQKVPISKKDLFLSPPTKNANVVISAFSQTGKYHKAFLKDLENGLKRSSYFKN